MLSFSSVKIQRPFNIESIETEPVFPKRKKVTEIQPGDIFTYKGSDKDAKDGKYLSLKWDSSPYDSKILLAQPVETLGDKNVKPQPFYPYDKGDFEVSRLKINA